MKKLLLIGVLVLAGCGAEVDAVEGEPEIAQSVSAVVADPAPEDPTTIEIISGCRREFDDFMEFCRAGSYAGASNEAYRDCVNVARAMLAMCMGQIVFN